MVFSITITTRLPAENIVLCWLIEFSYCEKLKVGLSLHCGTLNYEFSQALR